ncbi:orotidine-5'-phosphate decarboxylase [Raineyella fluvialis]|uniref:Orotidine 5'-phosphate decarboxylase n=1 Tax=Raineyella fluvialis TaxID=2662261 RepID=A0A5Q2FDT1_9ACTN|nr:orotidine-5'-phosphate decarboxylase [Raineyella fluvialis]QGF24531.1 orotidine-5'-phosphate decarboxylase [Raineyella fluvialis]
MPDSSYAARLGAVTAARGRLCVGIDPHPSMLDAWGLPHTAAGLESCARGMVEALGETVATFKPQSALFEEYGAAGIAVLESVLDDIRAAGALSILDVKRGDIGSTMAGYARAYLRDEAPLAADAITLSPYLGYDSLLPAIDLAIASGRGVYVLARTSNPEGDHVQLAVGDDGRVVAQQIVDAATETNRRVLAELPPEGATAPAIGPVGLVVGATRLDTGVDLDAFNGSILAPGIGAQGGKVTDLPAIFGASLGHVLPTTSRGVMAAGPGAEALRQAARTQVMSMV